MELPEKIEFFLSMMSCFQDISYWKFDKEFNVLFSNCEQSDIVKRILFEEQERNQSLLEYGRTHDKPLVCSKELGLIWGTVFEKADGEVVRLHVLGPICNSELSIPQIEQVVDRQYTPMRFRRKLINLFARLPVLSAPRFYPFLQMLHFCITGEKITFSEIAHEKLNPSNIATAIPEQMEEEKRSGARHQGVYAAEQELFKMIEDGNINYAHAMNNAALKATFGDAKYQDPQQKNHAVAVTFITLSIRAAIRGGLPPATAYAVGDYYESAVAGCTSMTEQKHILDTMFHDFVLRVHKCKENAGISKPIQVCCDYIDIHIYEKIELETLAATVGYTKYYLTRKFKSELGVSIWDYVNKRKVEQAKILLTNPEYTIQEISDMLGYCSRSYFSEVFQTHTGSWPSDYRTDELKM